MVSEKTGLPPSSAFLRITMTSFGAGLRLTTTVTELAVAVAGRARCNKFLKSGVVFLACSRLHRKQLHSLQTVAAPPTCHLALHLTPSSSGSAHTNARTRFLQGQKNSSCNSVNLARKMSGDSDTLPNPSNLIFRQLFDYQSYTYTYLLGDKDTKDAILIDPVIELVRRDMHLVEDLGLNLVYAINTHCHADHITGSGLIKEKIPSCRSIISGKSGAKADMYVDNGDQIKFGNLALDVLSTPGHTSGCVTFVLRNETGTPIMAFTGDTILIRGCGRTDFQEGDSGELYDSAHNKILSLPPTTRLHPAHDYTGQTVTTVKEELQFNPRLTKTREEFIKTMKELNLPYPKAIDKALPANLVCGIVGEGYRD